MQEAYTNGSATYCPVCLSYTLRVVRFTKRLNSDTVPTVPSGSR